MKGYFNTCNICKHKIITYNKYIYIYIYNNKYKDKYKFYI